jgi:hypothetical protein
MHSSTPNYHRYFRSPLFLIHLIVSGLMLFSLYDDGIDLFVFYAIYGLMLLVSFALHISNKRGIAYFLTIGVPLLLLLFLLMLCTMRSQESAPIL